MKNQSIPLRRMVTCALIAALYAAASLALAPLSYGNVQFRVSEALTLLPVLMPDAVLGVSLGCAISNVLGAATGLNPLGFPDAVIGTLATVLAALCTHRLRHVRWKGLPVAAAVPPVLFNALFLGTEFTLLFGGGMAAFWLFAAQIAIGEAAVCFLLGVPLVRTLENTGLAARWNGSQV